MRKIIGLLAVCVISFAGTLAMAAEPTRVAVANPARIFNEMQELKDLRAKMDSERRLLEGVDVEKRQKLQALQAARDALKPDTQQYREKNDELFQATAEYEAWGRVSNAKFQREQKLQLKHLYAKIEEAIAEVAKQKGFDLVICDQRAELPEDIDRLSIDQLRATINARTVLYAVDAVDISNEVLALLDAKYRSGAARQQPDQQPQQQ